MSYSKRNETKKTGLAFCRVSGTDEAMKHHLSLQERHIEQAALEENVTLTRIVKVRNQHVALPALMELVQGVDVLYVTSPGKLTRSHKTFISIVSKLKANGVEVHVADEKRYSTFDGLLDSILQEQMYQMQRELQSRARRRNEYC
jgi:DNA invertase Pin-like site-specific DNA recombinase